MIPFLGSLYFRLVGATSRVVWLDRDIPHALDRAGRGFVYAFWHAQQASLVDAYRDEPVCILVSRSRDGQWIADTLAYLGLRTARGSSSRGGGTAIRQMLRYAEGGLHPAITPDGPKGPAQKAKAGALYLAQRLGVPVVPVAAAPRRRIVFRGAWDAFELPLPFNRIVIAHGPPVSIGADESLLVAGSAAACTVADSGTSASGSPDSGRRETKCVSISARRRECWSGFEMKSSMPA